MKEIVKIYGVDFEYDFLSGWIKYNRLCSGISQEALSFGICSKSHLSYFENGKKKLRSEIIELLLKKLEIKEIIQIDSIGLIRKKFNNMALAIEYSNYDEATNLFEEISKFEPMMILSPYNIEYKIYKMFYNFFVLKKNYEQLKKEHTILSKIFINLKNEIKYIFLLLSGKMFYKYVCNEKGINYLLNALKIKNTPIINYYIGFSYCFNAEPLRGTFYLEKSLNSYVSSGHYQNALWCHNALGICYSYLSVYDKAEDHFISGINGAKYFEETNIYEHLMTNISDLYMKKGDYIKALEYGLKALEVAKEPILIVVNCIEIYEHFKMNSEIEKLFDNYYLGKYKESKYFLLLKFTYLRINDFNRPDFYNIIIKEILSYYKSINYVELCDNIRKYMIVYLENRRRYKEATILYKELLRM